jgi:copper(I)-binding protein
MAGKRLYMAFLLLPGLALAALPLRAEGLLRLEDAWVRALPPTQRMTAAYVRVRNAGDVPVRITGAEVTGAGRVELHESAAGADGMARMVPVPALPLAPGESAAFTPGGLHLMLMDLERMPAVGETLRLCLLGEGGSRSCTDATVKRGPGHHH